MSSSASMIVAALEAMGHEFTESARSSTSTLAVRRRLASTNSLVLFLESPSRSGSGIVAKYIRGERASKLAEAEALYIRELEPYFQQADGLRLPRVLAHDPASGLVLSEEIVGVRLDLLIGRFLRKGGLHAGEAAVRHAESKAADAGRWLARLHQVERVPMANLRSTLTERLDAALYRLRPIVGDSWGRWIRPYFMRGFQGFDTTRAVVHHPDYSPYNMIASDTELYVLDLSEIGIGHPSESAAFWWAYVEWLSLLPWIDRHRAARIQRAFLMGLGSGQLPELWQRWGLLLRLSYMTDPGAGPVRSLWQRVWRRRLSRWLASRDWRT